MIPFLLFSSLLFFAGGPPRDADARYFPHSRVSRCWAAAARSISIDLHHSAASVNIKIRSEVCAWRGARRCGGATIDAPACSSGTRASLCAPFRVKAAEAARWPTWE